MTPRCRHVLAFIQYLAGYLNSPLSIKNTIGALSTAFKQSSWDPSPFSSYAVQTALRSLDINMRYIPIGKRPITLPEVESVITYLAQKVQDPTLVCAISFAYVGMFRQSNLAPQTSAAFDATRQFTRADARVISDGIIILLKWSKTIQAYRDATTVYLPRMPASVLCPVRAYTEMVAQRPTLSPADPLLMFPNRRPMSIGYLNRRWRQALHAIGLPVGALKLHSLRRGAATMVWQSGMVKDIDLMTHGTWATPAWRAYASKPAQQSAVAQVFKKITD